eukprot:GHVQ01025136.1.p1 GENE.GHVQ01025136.1~~GHVQ01025136.1.p1  ORF type:complete len:208 (-),score=34.12 GHVQ01025136.1:17-640(-)
MSYTASDMSYLHNHNPHHHNGQTDMRAVGSYVESLSSPPPPDSTQPAETSLSPSAPIYFHYFHTAFSDLGEFWTSAPSLEAMFFKKVFGAPLHLKPLSFPHVSAFSGLELPYAAFHSVTENQEKLPDESIKLCEWSNGELMQKIGEVHRHTTSHLHHYVSFLTCCSLLHHMSVVVLYLSSLKMYILLFFFHTLCLCDTLQHSDFIVS